MGVMNVSVSETEMTMTGDGITATIGIGKRKMVNTPNERGGGVTEMTMTTKAAQEILTAIITTDETETIPSTARG